MVEIDAGIGDGDHYSMNRRRLFRYAGAAVAGTALSSGALSLVGGSQAGAAPPDVDPDDIPLRSARPSRASNLPPKAPPGAKAPPVVRSSVSAPAAALTPGYGYLPMSPSSPWNLPIPAGTQWYGPPATTDPSRRTLWWEPNVGVRRWYMNTDFKWSSGIWIAQPTDPTWTFALPKAWRGHPAGTFTLRAPANLKVGGVKNGDNPASVIVDGELWDLYGVVMKGTRRANLYAFGHQPYATGTGFGTAGQMWDNGTWKIDPATGTRAANTPWGVGMITADDLAAPEILHALAVALPESITASRGVAPVTAFDNGGYGTIPSGTRIGIPAGITMPAVLADPRWNGLGIRFWKVWQTYGGFVVDTADPLYPVLYADPVSIPGGPGLTAIDPVYAWWNSWYTENGVQRSIMDIIQPYLRLSQPY
jgi:hypothetical protein